MSMNFCHLYLSTTITSSCLCSDGYEAENLLSSTQPNGFQAERFARPPAYITVTFPIPIQLDRITVRPWVGQQCVKDLQLYIARINRSNALKSVSPDEVKYKAGRAVLSTPVEVSFVNKHYRAVRCLEKGENEVKQSGIIVDVQGNMDGILAIKLGIISMLTGTVPSIGGLSIWGKPSNKCKRNLANSVIQKWLQNQNLPQCTLINNSITVLPTLTNKDESDNESADKTEIPKQFVDPIVCSVMRNPVLLPSGHTVDQHTLDKHIITQSDWGRLPSDPFTGILFTEQYKPVPHVALKLQLDSYLLNRKSQNGKSPNLTKTTNQRKRIYSDIDVNENPSKVVKFHSHCSKTHTSVASKLDEHDLKLTSLSNSMENSLEAALSKAKIRTSKFRTVKTSFQTTDTIHCCRCKVFLSSVIIQYSLPCGHRLCRECLHTTSNFERMKPSASSNLTLRLSCPSCETLFNQSDVTRVYK
nr:RING finger protein 37 isoform X1 [Ciona intestinalis]|eukprot:XP_009857651.1 RING finger protein 37 isoform X1 [Ciona intestinalis]